MNKITFNEFCTDYLDGLYDPRFSDEDQCNGYKLLKKMILDDIHPANSKEIKRWEENPTPEERYDAPSLKYMCFLHPLLRPVIYGNWSFIKGLVMREKLEKFIGDE